MKLKKIIAAIAASAVAISTMAISAFADTTYHAYLGVQTNPSWIYRNAWNDATYGKDVDGWDYSKLAKDGAAADIGGTFTDVEFSTDGTYKVSLTGADLSSEELFSLLFISTDVPVDSGVKFTDVKVIIDGNTKYTFDEGYIPEDTGDYIQIQARNIWNDDLGKEEGLFGYTMPTDSVEMEFTVSGLGGAAASSDAGTEDAGTTTETTAPTTGNVPAAVMASVMVVAGTAAVASRKRK